VVLWTRVAERFHGADVRWEVFDPVSGAVLRRSSAAALPERDGTVQVAVDGLPSGAYRELADMDCDLVLHLGDDVYASPSGTFGDPLGRWDTVTGREHQPDRETETARWYQVATDRPGAPASPLMAWQTLRGTNRLLPALPG